MNTLEATYALWGLITYMAKIDKHRAGTALINRDFARVGVIKISAPAVVVAGPLPLRFEPRADSSTSVRRRPHSKRDTKTPTSKDRAPVQIRDKSFRKCWSEEWNTSPPLSPEQFYLSLGAMAVLIALTLSDSSSTAFDRMTTLAGPPVPGIRLRDKVPAQPLPVLAHGLENKVKTTIDLVGEIGETALTLGVFREQNENLELGAPKLDWWLESTDAVGGKMGS